MFTPLSPGDIIATGTPDGIGAKQNPPVWMKAGDVLEVEISSIGTLRNTDRRREVVFSPQIWGPPMLRSARRAHPETWRHTPDFAPILLANSHSLF